ncbi:MAG: DUF1266 domain-containing protein [Lachnospiraceae bacterium]|nr:DUF1266 domain-containing protein [Lachnospiraceae bacterium]
MKKIKFIHRKQIICVLCICALSVGLFSGCSKKNSGNEQAAAPEATAKILVSEESSDSNLGKWARAMGSVLISLNEGNVYYFGGYEHTEGNQKAAANILQQSWNISDRTQLITEMYTLLKTGARASYRKEAKEMNSMSAKKLRTAMKQLSGELKIHYEMVQYNWETWQKRGLLAWDMCRISHLAQWGYVAGYLDIEEAQAVIEPAAKKLKENFTSWDEVQKNWLDGYALYASIDATASTGTDYEARQKQYEELKEKDVARTEEILYDDSLFSGEILPLVGITAENIWQEVTSAKEETKQTINSKDDKSKDSSDKKDDTDKDTSDSKSNDSSDDKNQENKDSSKN